MQRRGAFKCAFNDPMKAGIPHGSETHEANQPMKYFLPAVNERRQFFCLNYLHAVNLCRPYLLYSLINY